MNIEELLNNAVDCAINDETLQKVLISFLKNGNVNCRVLALDEDKEVSKQTENTDVIRLYQLKAIKLILDKLRNDGGIKENALSRLISNDEKDPVHSCNASLLKGVTLDDINYLNDLSVEEIKDILDGKMSIDENKYKLLKFIETYMANLTKDGNGKNSIFMSEEQYTERPLHLKNEAYTKRVYLNTPEGEDRYKFLYLYIQKYRPGDVH